jgi:hypothetical protein
MQIELKPALPIQSLEFLQKTFLPSQRTRRDKVVAAVEDGTRRIDAARKSVTVPTIGERRANGTVLRTASDQELQRAAQAVAERQVADKARQIRTEVDAIAVPLLKEMIAAADQAKVYSERHWDLWSVLRRAKGLGTGTSGFVEAIQLRAAYGAMLKGCDPLELARWAQQAVDQADVILADAVARENMTRDNRPFANQALAKQLSVPDYVAAQEALRDVLRLHQEAGAVYAGFGREIGAASMQRIALGLARQGDDLDVDEAGGIRLPGSVPVLK